MVPELIVRKKLDECDRSDEVCTGGNKWRGKGNFDGTSEDYVSSTVITSANPLTVTPATGSNLTQTIINF